MFYVGLFMALFGSMITVHAQCTSSGNNCSSSDAYQYDNESRAVSTINSGFDRAAANDTFFVHSNVGIPFDFNALAAASYAEDMDAAFGAGNWSEVFYETVDPNVLFAQGVRFVYLEGSDDNLTELDTFLQANQVLIESFVSNGGSLLINAAPNEGGNINLGFGGKTLNNVGSGLYNSVTVTNLTHPAFVGPNTPTSTVMMGNNYAHADISGTGASTLIEHTSAPNQIILSEEAFGNGTVIFGGMTASSFHTPAPDARNFKINLLIYLESLATLPSGPIPEILYYRFEETGTSVTNEASAPPAGTATATINGGSSQGAPPICGVGSLQSNSTVNESMSTGWNTDIGTSSWSIALKVRDIGSGVFAYLMGDINAANFRIFANGAAGTNNMIIRGGGISDVIAINGANPAAETTTVFVYDNIVQEIRAYVDGVLVSTVPQGALNINGTGLFVGNQSLNGTGLPIGAALDEFRFYSRALSATEVANLTACNTVIPSGDAPVITCPADIMLNNTPGECSAIANFGGTATDTEDGNISGDIVATPASGSAFPVGTTVVTLSITDSDGNTSECMFNVTVVDNEAAVLTCPADISQTNDAGLCGADVTVPTPNIDDNCPVILGDPTIAGFTLLGTASGSSYYLSNSSFTAPDAYTDAASNGGFVVTMADATENEFVRTAIENLVGDQRVIIGLNDVATEGTFVWENGEPVTFTNWSGGEPSNGGGGEDYVEMFGNGLWNDLNGVTAYPYVLEVASTGNIVNDFNGTNDASGFYPVGDTVVTFTYTDAGGNVATCSMTVTVTDDEAPMIVCIGGPSASAGSATGTGGAIPDNNPVGLTTTLDVTDDFDITDLNVNLDITHTWIGDLAVTLTAPDGTTMAAIMDRPGVPATVVGCNNADPAINIDLDDEAVDTVEDSCPEPYVGSFIPNEALSAFDGISTLGTWTLEITDSAAGDTGTLNGWTLNYEYSVAASPAFPVILDADGNATVTASDLIDATASSDNCGIASITVEGMGGAPMPGSITTVFDSNNNGATGGAVYFDITVGTEDVTISDLDVNTLQPGALTVEMYTLVGTYVGNEGDPAPWTLSATGTGTASGTLNVPSNAVLDTPVTLTANTTYGVALVLDAAHGHYYSGTGTDPAPGMLMYSNADLSLSLGAGGNVPFSGTPFSPRIWNGTLNYTAGSGAPGPVTTFDVDCSNVGENEIEVTVTDVNGNVSTCTATYEVIDNIDPILVCQDFTLELGADGTAMLDPMDLIDMTNTIEACGISIDAVSMDDFSCDDIGTPQTVTLFVSDPSGNLASCEATVTVVDLLRTRSYLSCRYDCRSGSKQPIV